MSVETVEASPESEPCRRRRFSTWSRCGCEECLVKRRRADKLRRVGKSTPQASIRVQREAARQEIMRLLAEKWSPTAIADAYNLPFRTLQGLCYTFPAGRVQLPGIALARIILAGPVRRPTVGHLPAWPVTRRLQALGAIGYTNSDLRVRLGFAQSVISDAQAGRRPQVSARFDTAVRALYVELENTPGPSATAVRNARAKKWGTPASWDNIDDPAERPKGLGGTPHRKQVAS